MKMYRWSIFWATNSSSGVDVVLTTPRVLHLRKVYDTIDVLGLMTMFTFVHLHWTKIVEFNSVSIAQFFHESGWRSALKYGKDSYHTSKLTVVGLKSNLPHANSKAFIHTSSSSDDDESDKEEDKDALDSVSQSSESTDTHVHGAQRALPVRATNEQKCHEERPHNLPTSPDVTRYHIHS